MPRARYNKDMLILNDKSTSDFNTSSLFNNKADSRTNTDLDSCNVPYSDWYLSTGSSVGISCEGHVIDPLDGRS
ncbi:hypothetical protein DL98DRAFT_523422 [Cadophora sp. DSE1049]|nr:hypothetical protein DL98DRAFT_523422 [Cadophora sp. DSE1049]